ncbi:MAG: 30S ribosomal protein S4 [Chloroflexi bacterium]|nr:30S ribosomal protein S4 [Chloroflexota bacterium]
MARYTGPACRLCRRIGEKLFLKGGRCFTPKCAADKRSKAPGQTQARRRPKVSDRGIQLHEKQKARFSYGLMERQFKNYFLDAEKQPGITGDNLMVILERRLDNAVFRLGFADSRSQARQLVRHGHITLNGRKTNIPSRLIGEGDTIGWREGSVKTELFKMVSQAVESKTVPGWLTLDREKLIGKVITMPTPNDVDLRFDGKAIVEYYSR